MNVIDLPPTGCCIFTVQQEQSQKSVRVFEEREKSIFMYHRLTFGVSAW